MEDMQKENVQDSRTVLEQLKLVEHWDNEVILLMPNEKEFFIDGTMEIYLSPESFTDYIHGISEEQKMAYSRIPILFAMDTICKNDCKGIRIHGFEEGEIYITREEMMPLQEITDLIYMFQAVRNKQITVKRAVQLLRDKVFYMLGDIPTALNTEDDFFNFDVTSLKEKSYDAVKLYMTKERAETYNVRNFEIHSYTFGELANKFRNRYGLAIEPQQSFAAVFAPDVI